MAELNWDNIKSLTSSMITWTYWIVGLVIAATISYVLFNRFNKQVAAVLVFMTSVLALYYYYVKWFIIGMDYTPPKGSCPDFLSNIGSVSSSKPHQFVCIDQVGVSDTFGSDKNATDVAGLSIDINTLKNEGIVFQGIGSRGYVVTPDPTASTSETNTFCTNLKNAGLSWISRCEQV